MKVADISITSLKLAKSRGLAGKMMRPTRSCDGCGHDCLPYRIGCAAAYGPQCKRVTECAMMSLGASQSNALAFYRTVVFCAKTSIVINPLWHENPYVTVIYGYVLGAI